MNQPENFRRSLDLAEQLGAVLRQKSLKLVTAESCTGGGIAWILTSVPGSSQWFERGLVVYSNRSKQELLGVDPVTLAEYGAVSVETAQQMAAGALENSAADISVAVTGIAGPDGGSAEKPVGTVCLAWQRRSGQTRSIQVCFPGDRACVRESTIQLALEGLLELSAQP